MDLLSSLAKHKLAGDGDGDGAGHGDSDAHNPDEKKSQHPQSHGQGHGHEKHAPPSSADLLKSAKVVAGAASAARGPDGNKMDKGQVAEAAADLLGAASHYGKLEDKSLGKYLDKAEDYLHKYHASHPTAAGSHSGGGGHSSVAAGGTHSPPHPKEKKDGHSGSGGYGDYVKMAEGFLKKH